MRPRLLCLRGVSLWLLLRVGADGDDVDGGAAESNGALGA